MDWLDNVLEQLSSHDAHGYHAKSAAATEPVSLAAIALIGHGRPEQSSSLIQWLLENQQEDGCLGVDGRERAPCWSTGWAVLAWRLAMRNSKFVSRLPSAIERAVESIVRSQSFTTAEATGVGHDTTIRGWAWIDGTHSWVEPTAINVLALNHSGHRMHPRTREGVRLLQNRLLAAGGINYGNTVVLGQQLRPHVQPTGLALLALSGEVDPSDKTARSIAYLERELSAQTATASLCFALLGLAAHDRAPRGAAEWLSEASQRTLSRDPGSYRLALLALAAQGVHCPIIFRIAEHPTQ
jgi:hypothetical protein